MGKTTAQSSSNGVSSSVGIEEDIWGQILNESSRKTKDSTIEEGTVLLLGDRSTGKSSLVARMQGLDLSEASNKGVALSYTFIDSFEDENDDPVGRMNIWQLEGETSHSDLLRFGLNGKSMNNAVVIIALDFSQPWSLLESLKKWFGVLTQHIRSIQDDVPKSFEDKVRVMFQTYTEPQISGDNSNFRKNKRKAKNTQAPLEDLSVLPPLDPSVLTNNLGVPILVVCCKCDSVSTLEKDYDYKEQTFEYIQQHLRRICLSYGAGLVYTSARRDTNCSLLLETLENLLFHFELRHRPQLLISPTNAIAPNPTNPSSPSLFVPIGWDSLAKINIDFQNQNLTKDPEEPYENIVKKPNVLKRREQIVPVALAAEDDQEFLVRHRATIEKDDSEHKDDSSDKGGVGLLKTFQKMGGAIVTSTTPENTPTVIDDDDLGSTTIPSLSNVGLPGQSSAATAGGAPQDKTALAEFFKGLMSKDKSSATIKKEVSKTSLLTGLPGKEKTRIDAEKELEKLKKASMKK